MSLDSDPEIAAAFGSGESPTSTPISDDPEIHAAFASTDEKKTPKSDDHKIGDELVQPVVAGLSSAAHSVIGGYKGLYTLATTRDPAQASQAVTDEQSKAYTYTPPPKAPNPNLGPQARAGMQDANTLPSPTVLGDFAAAHGASPGLSTALAVAPTALSMMAAPRGLGPQVPARSAQEAANLTAAQQSGGAAGAAPDLSAASAPLKTAISEASRKTGGAVNPVALQNHLEADAHGIQLMKGQATRDPVQFSEEQNQSTHPMIAQRLNEQNGQMVDAIDNIRRDASPTNVSNSPRENGQVAVDDLKVYDEPIRADIKAKYQKLADANGGAIPIDTGSTISSIDARLKKGSLTRTATNDPAVSEVMDNLRSGQPMDFESFESARSLLAGVQRKGGPAGVAAGIARDELEKMPLPPEAAPLKVLADDARAAASARFNELKRDPAYEAAVDDVNNGNAKGKPSPLADTFLDDYALNRGAPKQQVDLMMQKLSDEGKGAVASHTLSAIRKGAVNASGNVVPNGYNTAMAKYADKLPSLVGPDTQDSLQSLGRTITNAKVAPAGSSVAPKSGVIVRDALQGAMEHAANAKTMGAYGVLKKVFTKDGFAKEATAPGAGLDQLTTRP
jgi:hypothetical protein